MRLTLLAAVGVALAACGKEGPRRLDTRGWVPLRVEVFGTLLPWDSVGGVDEEATLATFAERLRRGREEGAFALRAAQRLEVDGEGAFGLGVDALLPPPCDDARARALGRALWEALSVRGDFGVHVIPQDAPSRVAALLRPLPAVRDVSSRAELRGLVEVHLSEGASAEALVEAIGRGTADLSAFVIAAANLSIPTPAAEGVVYLAPVRDAPELTQDAILSATRLPRRDDLGERLRLTFQPFAIEPLAGLTRAELGRHLVFVSDGEVLTAPVVGGVVRDASFELNLGPEAEDVANRIAAVLGTGGLGARPRLERMRLTCGEEPNALEIIIDGLVGGLVGGRAAIDPDAPLPDAE